MPLTILGEHPLARDAQSQLKSRIGTIFLSRRLLVTLPGVHAAQRIAYSDFLNQERLAQGRPPLTADEELAEWNQSVDLIMENDAVLIRPDPENMPLAFAADELLQELVSKQRIRFLNVMDQKVRQAIKQRGECWRISPLPQSPSEMERMIRSARLNIAERACYYYSMVTGTRYLTYHEFAQLGALDPQTLARQLHEIREFSGRRNRLYHREVDFFGVSSAFGHHAFAAHDFLQADPPQLTAIYADLKTRFRNAVEPTLSADDFSNLAWRNRMFSALIGQQSHTVAEEILQGLSPEFFMQIQWLAGGRIEDGEFIFDPIFDELAQRPGDQDLAAVCDEKVKGFIFNFIREFGDIEYVNIGTVAGALTHRPRVSGRRFVYIAEIKRRDHREPVARVLRMQKWDIQEKIEEGKDLLKAIMEADEYTEYVLDRRLGCRQLGMNLPGSMLMWRIFQTYRGPRKQYDGQILGYTYFERTYVPGVATDKIASLRYQSREFALRFARLQGRAAASSIIVGKADLNGDAQFDDGDEILVEDAHGLPSDFVVCDPTGTFLSYTNELAEFASDYARSINNRLALVPDPAAFTTAWLAAFLEQFLVVQQKYRHMKRGYDTLFKHRRRDELGSFAYRWEKVLERLDRTDAPALTESIRQAVKLP